MKDDEQNFEELIDKGFALYNNKLYEDALYAFDKALEIIPEYEDILISKGLCYAKLRKYEDAIECIDMVLRINPKNENALFNRGKILYDYGEYLQHNEKDILNTNIFNEAMDFLDEALKINPKNVDAWIYKGKSMIYFNPHYALTFLDNALEIDPENKDVLFYKLDIMIEFPSGSYKDCERIFDYLFESNYDEEKLLLLKADYYESSFFPDFDDSRIIGILDRVLKINPKNEDAWIKKTKFLKTVGKFEEIYELYCEMMESIPKIEDELNCIEKFLLEDKNLTLYSAVEKLKYGLESFNLFIDGIGVHDILSKLSPYEIGEYWDSVDDFNKSFEEISSLIAEDRNIAKKIYGEILRNNPHNSEALRLLVENTHPDERQVIIDEFMQENEENTDAVLLKAQTLEENGRLEESSKVYDKLFNKLNNVHKDTPKIELKINNIGPINEADLKFGKLNIVGGINGSGKTTAAKLLFSFLFSSSPEGCMAIFEEYKNSLLNQSLLLKYREKFLEIKNKPLDKTTEIYKALDSLNSIIHENDIHSLECFIMKNNEIVDKYLNELIEVCGISDKSKNDFYLCSDLMGDEINIDFYMKNVFKREFRTMTQGEVKQLDSSTENSTYEGRAVLNGTFEDKSFSWQFIRNKESIYWVGSEFLNYSTFPLSGNNAFYMNPVSFLNAFKSDRDKFFYSRNYDSVYDFEMDFHNVVFLNSVMELPHTEFEKLHSSDIWKRLAEEEDDDERAELLEGYFDYDTHPNKCRWCGRDYSKNIICPYCRNNFKMAKLQSMIDKVIGGKFAIEMSDFPELKFLKDGTSYKINQTSSGIQQIGIMEMLLCFGMLKKNDFIIIDEPEVSLHPEWQMRLAEIIVLLVKELEINVYINSHSPHFIEALEVLSVKYGIDDETRFFMTVPYKDTGKYDFIELDYDNVNELYLNIGNPYHEINEIRLENKLRDL